MQLYPYGFGEDDFALPKSDDEESSLITLAQRFIFYGQSFQTVYVCYLCITAT